MVLHLIVIAGAAVVLVPFFWMLSSSLKREIDVFRIPPQFIPSPVVWVNYPEALSSHPWGLFLANTLIIVCTTMFGALLSNSLVAFGFARVRFPLRGLWFLVVLATMMLPRQVTLIPLYMLFRNLGWLDTFKPLIVPSYFASAFYIFLLRQFMMTIPIEMDDAARIDGCNVFSIYWRIVLPLCKPALGTVAIFSFMGAWNDFFGPLIYLNDPDKRTLALGLKSLAGWVVSSGPPRWAVVMAMSFLVMLPCLILFFFTQRYFIQGVVITGVKG